MLLNIFNKFISPLGLVIERTRPEDLSQRQTMYGAIRRCRLIHHINPGTIIDVGAAEGKWTLMTLKEWNKSNYVLFEPLKERENILLSLKKRHNNIYVVNKAAGNSKSEIEFYVTKDLDGSGIADNGTNAYVSKIEVTSIDEEIRNLKLAGPYVIKLDTHGYEIPILEGAIETLKQTQLLIIECYGFKIAPNSLLLWEMCEYLKNKGFRLIDIVDIVSRKKDWAFWQCDVFFISDDAESFKSNTYV